MLEKVQSITQVCTKCNHKKSLPSFGPSKLGKNGKNNHCRTCENKRQQEELKIIRLEVFTYYCQGIPHCQCPGCEERNIGFLTIEHPNNDGKIHRKQLKGRTLYHGLRSAGFPPGVKVFCWNCNSGKNYRGHGVCPHLLPEFISYQGEKANIKKEDISV